MPSEGKNFEGYSFIAAITGRTYVHTSVRDIIVGSYKRLEKIEPNKIYKYAETGFFDLWRVIFDPKLQPKLFKTKYGDYLKANVQFSKKRSWLRHDEHYHVDFSVPCK